MWVKKLPQSPFVPFTDEYRVAHHVLAYGKLAEVAEQVGKMVEHPKSKSA